jgi:hypothetical protein
MLAAAEPILDALQRKPLKGLTRSQLRVIDGGRVRVVKG